MRYAVRWFDVTTETIREERVEASSEEAAASRWRSSGQAVIAVERLRVPLSTRTQRFDVAWWCRELRTLLLAGMTVVEAIATLNAQGRTRSDVNATLLAHLEQGKSLSVAMQLATAFPAVLIAGVKSGEMTSGLAGALEDYLKYHDMLARLRKQVTSAAIYPALVVGLGGVIAIFLLLFVIPRFASMYGELHGPVSFATRVLVATSRGLANHGTLLGAFVAAGIVALTWAWRTGAVARLAMATVEAIPALRAQADEHRLAKFYQALALMFRGGYTLDAALHHTAGLALGARLSQATQAAEASLARGQRVSKAFTDAGLADAVAERLLAVGERTGNFDRVLQAIAERHAERFTTFVERTTRLVEPVLLLLVALVVGGIVVAMYMPVFDIASSVR